MEIIKKYANRKLYHTNRKQYIRLEGIALLIQSGKQVQVIDNETGEDITASILAQVVSQVRGQHSGGMLPTNVLTQLIRFGGDTVANLRQALFTSLNLPGTVEVEIVRRLNRLVDDGSLTKEEATRLRRLLVRQDVSQSTYSDLVASRKEILRMQQQLDMLTEQLSQIIQQQSEHNNSMESYEKQSAAIDQ